MSLSRGSEEKFLPIGPPINRGQRKARSRVKSGRLAVFVVSLRFGTTHFKKVCTQTHSPINILLFLYPPQPPAIPGLLQDSSGGGAAAHGVLQGS